MGGGTQYGDDTMLPSEVRATPRPLADIAALVSRYPEAHRRWCTYPEQGGCHCMGCVRHPAPGTVRGDPEACAWPDEADALTAEEMRIYREAYPAQPRADGSTMSEAFA